MKKWEHGREEGNKKWWREKNQKAWYPCACMDYSTGHEIPSCVAGLKSNQKTVSFPFLSRLYLCSGSLSPQCFIWSGSCLSMQQSAAGFLHIYTLILLYCAQCHFISLQFHSLYLYWDDKNMARCFSWLKSDSVLHHESRVQSVILGL